MHYAMKTYKMLGEWRHKAWALPIFSFKGVGQADHLITHLDSDSFMTRVLRIDE
jgi:hypothetical protein